MFLKISKMLLIFPYRLDKLHRHNLDFQNGLKRMLPVSYTHLTLPTT